jgi:hypothetical protein
MSDILFDFMSNHLLNANNMQHKQYAAHKPELQWVSTSDVHGPAHGQPRPTGRLTEKRVGRGPTHEHHWLVHMRLA